MGAIQAALERVTDAWGRWSELEESPEKRVAANELHAAHAEAKEHVTKDVRLKAASVDAWEALRVRRELLGDAEAAQEGAKHITDDTDQPKRGQGL